MMKLMPDKPEINPVRRGRPFCLAVLVGLAAVVLSCTPKLHPDKRFDLSPVEIIERSPRIYHIKFEAFSDSIDTVRAARYLKHDWAEPADRGTTPGGTESERRLAEIEYWKARRRLAGGAGRAALQHVRKALEIDPGFKPSYVLLGKLLLAQGRVNEASDLFTKIVSWDVTNSDALVGLARCHMLRGQVDLARKALVDAIIFDRVNLEAWSVLERLGMAEKFTVTDHDLPELGLIRKAGGRHYDLVIDQSVEECASVASAWIVFTSQRAVWRYEGKFKYYTGKTKYAPTYEEDIDCYMALVAAWKVLGQQDSTGCDTAYLDHMSRVAEDGFLLPHVLFDYVCLEHPRAARGFSAEMIGRLRDYINTYVLVSKG
jgi:tetratricopeptide (TPR) repeat protein